MISMRFLKKIPPVVFVIWLIWLFFVVLFSSGRVDISEIYHKEGLIISAKCSETRTSIGLDVVVQYQGQNSSENDLYFLPLNQICNANYIANIIGKKVSIQAYKNRYLEVRIGNVVVKKSLREYLQSEFKNIIVDVIFVTFIALIATFLYVKKERFKKQ